MTKVKFTTNDEVYSQEGSRYLYSHAVGDNAFVHPIVVTQVTNYHGDDFEEHEEPAEHCVLVKANLLSKTPWISAIHKETKEALEEKKVAIDAANRNLGAATTELRVRQKDLEAFKVSLDKERQDILDNNRMLRDFKSFIGVSKVYGISKTVNGHGVPEDITGDLLKELRMTREGEIYEYDPYGYDKRAGFYFASKAALERKARDLYNNRENKTLEAEATWLVNFPFLNVSRECLNYIDEKNAEKAMIALEKAEKRFRMAKDDMDSLKREVEAAKKQRGEPQ